MDETYEEPEVEEYKPRVRFQCFPCYYSSYAYPYQEHLRAWLGDAQLRDQYATYRGDDVMIHWHGKSSQCEVAYTPKDPVRACVFQPV